MKSASQPKFYKKEGKKITPVPGPQETKAAKLRLKEILAADENVPDFYKKKWDDVALYDPSGSVDDARSILIDPDAGAYHLENSLNDMTGKEWVKFTCSWFIFNALRDDLMAEKKLDPTTAHHPATFSPTMVEHFIKFFTKKGATVIDPFCGIGSTLEACKRTGRKGVGIELNPKYHKLCLKRTPEFADTIYNMDARKVGELKLKNIDFSISSPPYWDILNRSTKDFKKTRTGKSLDVAYSDNEVDLGNIGDYNQFIEQTAGVYLSLHKLLKKGAYIVIIIKNIKKGGKMYPLAWDLARALSDTYTLKDEKIWIQDKVGLAPYGYPYSWASNILHHYCLVLRKEA